MGKVIPVIDLRARFGMGRIDCTDQTRIVVVDINTRSSRLHIGAVVDSVSKVTNMKDSGIEDSPPSDPPSKTDYIPGMAKVGGGVKMLPDIGRLLCADDMLMSKAA